MRKIFVALTLAVAVFATTMNSFAADSEKGAKLSFATFKFAGAACEASCEGVDKKLTSIKGIQAPKTCSVSKKTTFKYDPKALNHKMLLAAINKSGLKVEAQLVDFEVKGMACTSCSSKVTKTLTSIKGVKTNAVCHKSGSASIAFDPAQTSQKKLLAAINDLGYKASVKVAKAKTEAKK